MTETIEVFLVGSSENHFIVDQTHTDKQKAIDYCESRRNATHDWVVMLAPAEAMWINWTEVHRTRRIK